MNRLRGVARFLFEDRRNGRIVVAQMPNAAMWIVIAALALGFLVSDERVATATRIVLFLALAFWAFDEAARGVNPWRRGLGIATLLGIFVWLVVLKH